MDLTMKDKKEAKLERGKMPVYIFGKQPKFMNEEKIITKY